MPFTPAHTVAVFPFVKSRKMCATALIAGSMSPDFEYFIRMDVTGAWGHNLSGIVFFDLPMTLAMVVVFHLAVKHRLIDNLPPFFQRRFAHLKTITIRQDILERPATSVACACAGALTHVVWDGFTHRDGFFVQELTGIYDGAYVPYGGVNYPLWYSLQYISSIAGMCIVVAYILLMKPVSTQTVKPGFGYWIWLIIIMSAVVVVRFQFPHRPGEDMWAISAISGLCVGVIVLGLIPRGKTSEEVNVS